MVPTMAYSNRSLERETSNRMRMTVRHASTVEAGPVRRWIVRFLSLCCLVLIPWTIGLGVTLPRHYLVDNWPLAWTGFDAILLGCLSTTAWALWKQRQSRYLRRWSHQRCFCATPGSTYSPPTPAAA